MVWFSVNLLPMAVTFVFKHEILRELEEAQEQFEQRPQ
jgi:hypothetical protein